MLTSRLLVILYGLLSADDAADTVLNAISASRSPYGLRFAVPARLADELARMSLANEALAGGDIKPYDESLELAAIPPIITDETHFLLLKGVHGFSDGWDAALYERLRRVRDRAALITATLGDAEAGLPPRAYLPCVCRDFDASGAYISHGLPLVCSAAPVRTLIIDPAMAFGQVGFLRIVGLCADNLSLCAYMAGVPAYAMDIAPLYPLRPLSPRLLRKTADALAGTTVARFEQQAGFRFDEGLASVKTSMGLFFTDNAYPQRLPVALGARARARGALSRLRESGSDMPLTITAFIDLPAPARPLPEYMLRFGFMTALERLPLIAYTGGSRERYMRAMFPNTLSYPDGRLVPASLLGRGMTAWQRFGRGKLKLLALTLEKHPEFSHIAWADADLLTHPVCPRAMPEFKPLMDDRLHIATVRGVPDGSFFVAPAERLSFLTHEAATVTLLDAELKHSLSEEALWTSLIKRYPDMFALHPMPRRKLFMLSAFDARLLCEETRRLLEDPLPVILPDKEGSEQHGSKTAKAGFGKPR